MISPEDETDDQGVSSSLMDVSDAIEEGIQKIIEAIGKLDLKVTVQVDVPKQDQKAPIVELKTDLSQIKAPNVELHTQPHPFRHGLKCAVTSRDMNGDIREFTIEPKKLP